MISLYITGKFENLDRQESRFGGHHQMSVTGGLSRVYLPPQDTYPSCYNLVLTYATCFLSYVGQMHSNKCSSRTN